MIKLGKKKIFALRCTYLVATFALFVLLTIIVIMSLAFLHRPELLTAKLFSKLALGSMLAFAAFRLVDGLSCDRKGGLKIARLFHLWSEEGVPAPLVEVAKTRVWEGYALVEILLFVALAVMTIWTW